MIYQDFVDDDDTINTKVQLYDLNNHHGTVHLVSPFSILRNPEGIAPVEMFFKNESGMIAIRMTIDEATALSATLKEHLEITEVPRRQGSLVKSLKTDEITEET